MGEVYYRVRFFDEHRLVPEMRPEVFKGCHNRDGLIDPVFKDVSSHRNDEQPENCQPSVGEIFDYVCAIEALLRCSIRRREATDTGLRGCASPETDWVSSPLSNSSDAREIKPYGEPVNKDELEEGVVYFSATFPGEDIDFAAELFPLVFVKRGIDIEEPEGANLLVFQDAGSYLRGIRHDSGQGALGVEPYLESAEQSNHIYTYEHALDILVDWGMRRGRLAP
jgi:hypothetical protein